MTPFIRYIFKHQFSFSCRTFPYTGNNHDRYTEDLSYWPCWSSGYHTNKIIISWYLNVCKVLSSFALFTTWSTVHSPTHCYLFTAYTIPLKRSWEAHWLSFSVHNPIAYCQFFFLLTTWQHSSLLLTPFSLLSSKFPINLSDYSHPRIFAPLFNSFKCSVHLGSHLIPFLISFTLSESPTLMIITYLS